MNGTMLQTGARRLPVYPERPFRLHSRHVIPRCTCPRSCGLGRRARDLHIVPLPHSAYKVLDQEAWQTRRQLPVGSAGQTTARWFALGIR
jgi:hypothetical protein